MIVGYDLASYSYGSGPCVPQTMGYVRTETFGEDDRIRIMQDLYRRALCSNPSHPRATSVIATFHWEEGGDQRRLELRAGLLDRNRPDRAPYPYQTEAMTEFLENVWVGEHAPAIGITGTI